MIKINTLYSILFALLLTACGNCEKRTSINFIAHAGGAVEGVTMTNSREALLTARDNGFKFIELDLLFTADSMLVACHSWQEYNRAMGKEEKGSEPPTLNDFLSNELPGGFTPLSATEINDFFLSHDSIYFVTDKISDAKVLNKFFPKLKKRMMVEAFNYQDYTELLKDGYAYVSYSCMAEDIETAPIKHLALHLLFPGKKIADVALHTSALDYIYLKFLKAIADFKIMLFTVNDLKEIPREYIKDISFIYTDSLVPAKEKMLSE